MYTYSYITWYCRPLLLTVLASLPASLVFNILRRYVRLGAYIITCFLFFFLKFRFSLTFVVRGKNIYHPRILNLIYIDLIFLQFAIFKSCWIIKKKGITEFLANRAQYVKLFLVLLSVFGFIFKHTVVSKNLVDVSRFYYWRTPWRRAYGSTVLSTSTTSFSPLSTV